MRRSAVTGYERSMRGYLLCGLIAIELLMSFSFLGYFHIEPISITFAYIPILIAGCLMGPLESTLLGVVFGLASVWKASASYVSAGDRIFSPLLSGAPIQSILVSVGARALFGLLVGLLYLWAKKRSRRRTLWIAAISFVGKTLHSILVYGFLSLLFPEDGYRVSNAIYNFFDASNLIALFVTMGICLACWKIWNAPYLRRYRQRLALADNHSLAGPNSKIFQAVVVLLMILFAGMVAVYFVQRTNYMLGEHGIELSQNAYLDLMHLQIQFLLGILSLAVLVLLLLIFIQKYASYRSQEAYIDALTGVFNRKGFFQAMGKSLKGVAFGEGVVRYFLILDVDHFKQINDQYGHPQGDRILCEIVAHLKKIFGEIGHIGRLGGDEFVIFLHAPLTQEELEAALMQFIREVHEIECEGQMVSCSIGALPVTALESEEEIYQRADQVLYRAKEAGRDRYLIASLFSVQEERERSGRAGMVEEEALDAQAAAREENVK